jgi:hypothetical protein
MVTDYSYSLGCRAGVPQTLFDDQIKGRGQHRDGKCRQSHLVAPKYRVTLL